eukprot:CAMPEP_0119304686 /NCGR_PEP_ID=MMETSP1333-20130426/5843_1 /TAXON_ID=418940 /ORGANISM="Scyphosphaera apsteinii, Strain RCC1455" /LENGTH=128 /DNA_ID=CAMNT_0007307607 /DNA_START=84 /DNA_END=470 /DNA_ORIENTATION=-
MTGDCPGQKMLEMKRWAVIGDVLNESKPASLVVSTLKAAGKDVSLVNPRDTTGMVHKDISHVSTTIDVVDLIVNSRDGLTQVQSAIDVGVRQIFIQPGASSKEILDLCAQNGVVVHHGCVMVELNVPH